MTRKSIIIVFFLLILIPKIAQANTEKNTNNNKNIPPAPTLILPDASLKTSKPKPAITGLTANKTEVYIYIDGIYNGKTNILTHESGAANFSYLPFLNLKIGKHQIWAVAKDEQGNKSKISNILTFTIEEHFPAPTLIKIIKNTEQELKKASNKTIENGSHASSSLINAVINNRNSKSGIFNENDSEEKSQIQSSIFVIFILIIVGWILWVNKEAINT